MPWATGEAGDVVSVVPVTVIRRVAAGGEELNARPLSSGQPTLTNATPARMATTRALDERRVNRVFFSTIQTFLFEQRDAADRSAQGPLVLRRATDGLDDVGQSPSLPSVDPRVSGVL